MNGCERRKNTTRVASSTSSNAGNTSRRANTRAQEEYEISHSRARISDRRGYCGRDGNRGSNTEDERTPAFLDHRDPGGALPSAPPSYDEVIQVPYVPSAPVDDRIDPPPYSTTIS